MTVTEGRIPVVLGTEVRATRIGGARSLAHKALPGSLRRAAIVFLPLAVANILGFYVLVASLPAALQAAPGSGLVSNLGVALGVVLLLLAAVSLLIGYHATRQNLAEYELSQLNIRFASGSAALQALKHELETFSYSVSHDLRGPLRAIDGFCNALLEDYSGSLDAKGRDHLARVRNAAQRMGTLIDDILKLSHVGRAELNLVDDVDLTEIAGTIMDNLRRVDPGRQVEFVSGPATRARCDPRLLRIVLENLLGNAWKFTTGRRPAVIEFSRMHIEGNSAYFVRDNGVGFDMAHAGKLFGPFQRLHTGNEFPGTGIGLATVERIVKKHGGRVWAEAEPNGGATVFFTLSSAEPR